MKLLLTLLLAAVTDSSQSFRLEPDDYRWIPFTVTQTPTEVDVRFDVLQGGATVHIELLPMGEFRQFSHGHPHQTLALSPNSRSGAFRRIVQQRGQYAVIVKNARNASPATVSLELSTTLNPNAGVTATELPPRRRLVVIMISFLIFFALVTWSGLKLMRAIKP